MGAVAISTLSGATLPRAGEQSLTVKLRPFIGGLTLLYWATATWWIPWLLVIGIWWQVVRRYPAFEAGYWGLVFPLVMYTVATHAAAATLDLGPLASIASGFVWIALAAWALTLLDFVLTPLVRRGLGRAWGASR